MAKDRVYRFSNGAGLSFYYISDARLGSRENWRDMLVYLETNERLDVYFGRWMVAPDGRRVYVGSGHKEPRWPGRGQVGRFCQRMPAGFAFCDGGNPAKFLWSDAQEVA